MPRKRSATSRCANAAAVMVTARVPVLVRTLNDVENALFGELSVPLANGAVENVRSTQLDEPLVVTENVVAHACSGT